MALNIIGFDGRLTREPEARYTQGGQCICSFSVAHNDRYKDKSGEWKDKPTTFFECKAWGKIGEAVAANCHKGSLVVVTGATETEEWEKDGEKKRKQVVNAYTVSAVLQADRPSDGLHMDNPGETAVAGNSGSFGGSNADSIPF